MKKLCVTAAMIALMSSFAHAQPATMPVGAAPTAAVAKVCASFYDAVTNNVVSVLHDPKLDTEQKGFALSKIFQDAVDTDWIGQFVLGQSWKTAEKGDKIVYLSLYRQYLTKIYISKLQGSNTESFSLDNIKLLTIAQQQDNEYLAKTLILNKGEADVHVDYLLGQNEGKCQVHDIKVEGVSLLASHRSEFHAITASSGIKGVIAAMQKKLQADQ